MRNVLDQDFAVRITGERAGEGPRTARARTRLLVAEDNPVSQRVVLMMLQGLGYEARAVEDGEQALAALSGARCDLLLLDCEMPRMDGFEAVRRLRISEAEAGTTRLPVVALTANTREGDRARCLDAGMDDYIGKPVRREDLAKAISLWLPVGRRRVTSAGGQGAAGGSDEDALDIGRIRELSTCDRTGRLVADVLELYLKDAAELLAAIQSAFAQADLDGLERAAHSLQGSSVSAAAAVMATLSRKLEIRAGLGDLEGCQPLVLRLPDEFARVRSLMHEHIGHRD